MPQFTEFRQGRQWWFVITLIVVQLLVLVGGWLLLEPSMDRIAAIIVISMAVVGLSLFAMLWLIRENQRRLWDMHDNMVELVNERSRRLLQSRSAVIFGLAKLAESRDDDTGQHLERIMSYVEVLLDELAPGNPELTDDRVRTIIETSSLHDIGKVGIPDSVLLKPGRLTEEEFDVIKKHTTIGGDTLFALKQQWGEDDFLETACAITFGHHERWDGSGYPFGLSGDVIPYEARIVSIADVYDALTTKRVYKPAMSHEEACDIIRQGSGTQFDPDIVKIFERRIDDFQRIAEAKRDDGSS